MHLLQALIRSFFCFFVVLGTCFSAHAEDADACYLPLAGASICPEIATLKYNNKNNQWTADVGWKSTSGSFTTNITRFLGAQWKGVQMGHLICLYQGPNVDEFPVGLQKNIIVQNPQDLLKSLSPKGAQYTSPWTIKEDKTTITMDCYSPNNTTCDCPWIQFMEKKLSVDETVESIQKPTVYPPWAM